MSTYLEIPKIITKIIAEKTEMMSGLEVEDAFAAVVNWKVGIGLGATWLFLRKMRNRQEFHHLSEYEYGQYKKVPEWLPSINGRVLHFLAWICNTQFGDLFINEIIMAVLGLPKFRTLKLDEAPTYFPFAPHNLHVASPGDHVDISGLIKAHRELAKDPSEFRYRSALEYVQAYKNREFTPTDIAERIVETIKSTNPKLRILVDWHPEMILEQARNSSARYMSGKVLSPLDGTFCVVKDLFSVVGHCRRGGLGFVNTAEDTDDIIITKIREAGISIVGISNMTELGMSVFGANPSPHHGTCRNPINTDYYPGGSSSGTAAAVCSGLVPFGIGSDGGGSIRMPCCHTGIIGLKTTFSRISSNLYSKAKTCCSTVCTIGPVASNIIDLALFYQVLAGPVRGDAFSMAQPKVEVPQELTLNLDGIKIGVDWKWAGLSRPEIFKNFKRKIDFLAERGAEIIAIEVPELNYINTGHLISILSEGCDKAAELINKQRKISPDNAVILNAGSAKVTATDFLLAAKYRTRLMTYLKGLFKTIDVIANPTCAQTAERILESDESGCWKFGATLRYMMYVKLANYSGIPSITIPSGYAPKGLPTGIMLSGNWYSEEVLFKIGHVLDLDHKREKPEVFTDLLQ